MIKSSVSQCIKSIYFSRNIYFVFRWGNSLSGKAQQSQFFGVSLSVKYATSSRLTVLCETKRNAKRNETKLNERKRDKTK